MLAIPISIIVVSWLAALVKVSRSTIAISRAGKALDGEYWRQGKGQQIRRSVFGWAKAGEFNAGPGDSLEVVAAKERISALQKESIGVFNRALAVALGGMVLAVGVTLVLALIRGS
jgi:hypothetical protein